MDKFIIRVQVSYFNVTVICFNITHILKIRKIYEIFFIKGLPFTKNNLPFTKHLIPLIPFTKNILPNCD